MAIFKSNTAKQKPLQKQIEDYLNYCEFERNFTPQTMHSKRNIVRRFGMNVDVDDVRKITDESISAWRIKMFETGLSPTTLNIHIYHVVAFLKDQQQRHNLKLKIDPHGIRPMKVEEAEMRYFEPSDILKAKSACQGDRDLLLVSMFFETGGRISEVATLKVENIKDLTIRVLGKGRKRRLVFIKEDTRLILDRWILLIGITKGWVFPSPIDYDQHMSTDQIRRTLKRIFKNAGLPEFRPHDLRHSTATTLSDNGMDLVSIQRIMGHTDPKTTMRYIHTSGKKLAAKYQKFMSYLPQPES